MSKPHGINTSISSAFGRREALMNTIFTRRSIRSFTREAVSDSDIDKMLHALMQAPSAGNQQPWEVIVVRDINRLEKLSGVSPYAKMTADASVAFILLANEAGHKYTKFWQQDLAAATMNLLLQAAELGLGAVWLGVAPEEERMDYIRKLFKLPKHLLPFSVVPVGHSEKINEFIDRYVPSKVHWDEY